MYHTRYYTVSGTLKPWHAAGTYPVRVYEWKKNSSGHWISKGYVKAKAYNYATYTKYSVKLKLPSKGKWRLKAYAPADTWHFEKWSTYFDYVTVK